jgi:hypothetical protein
LQKKQGLARRIAHELNRDLETTTLAQPFAEINAQIQQLRFNEAVINLQQILTAILSDE